MHNSEGLYNLYYDEKCSLCVNAVKVINNYVKPINVKYLSLGSSQLEQETLSRALMEMLMIDSNGKKYWGLDTYLKLCLLSKSKYSSILRLARQIVKLPIVYEISWYVYQAIAKNRPRCVNGACAIK